MMYRSAMAAALALGGAMLAWSQSQAARSMPGTVIALRPESAELEVRLESGAVTAQLTADTEIRRVAPGARDLSQAEALPATSIRAGDRVLLTLLPDSPVARRIIVMPAADIARRNDEDRLDWARRGASGLVTSKQNNEIVLKSRAMGGESTATVTVTPATRFRRYAPGSVKFSDAAPSELAAIRPGDQLRARGEKSADGLRVTAEEVVFGTFVTKAGQVAAVDAAQAKLEVRETGSNKPLVVMFKPDSLIKQMPEFGAGGPGGPGGPGGFVPPPGGPGGFGPPPGGGSGRGPGMGPGPGRDLAQMLERLPAIPLSSLKAGDTVVFSSAPAAGGNEFTAILLVSNAGMLVRMAAAGMPGSDRGQSGRGATQAGASGFGGPGGGGLLEFPTMIP